MGCHKYSVYQDCMSDDRPQDTYRRTVDVQQYTNKRLMDVNGMTYLLSGVLTVVNKNVYVTTLVRRNPGHSIALCILIRLKAHNIYIIFHFHSVSDGVEYDYYANVVL